MPDYKQSKIYRIVCNTTGECYIGSTTQATLAQRLSGHCRDMKAWKNGTRAFVSSFLIIERANYRIELIENFQCENRDQLNAREGHYIQNTDCVNKRIEGRTRDQYYQANKEMFSNNGKAYREKNREQIVERRKAYYTENREEILKRTNEYHQVNRKKNLERNKLFYQANREVFLEKQKKYREKTRIGKNTES